MDCLCLFGVWKWSLINVGTQVSKEKLKTTIIILPRNLPWNLEVIQFSCRKFFLNQTPPCRDAAGVRTPPEVASLVCMPAPTRASHLDDMFLCCVFLLVVGYNTSVNVGCSIYLIYNTCISIRIYTYIHIISYLHYNMHVQFHNNYTTSPSSSKSNNGVHKWNAKGWWRDGLLRPQWNGKDHTVSWLIGTG